MRHIFTSLHFDYLLLKILQANNDISTMDGIYRTQTMDFIAIFPELENIF